MYLRAVGFPCVASLLAFLSISPPGREGRRGFNVHVTCAKSGDLIASVNRSTPRLHRPTLHRPRKATHRSPPPASSLPPRCWSCLVLFCPSTRADVTRLRRARPLPVSPAHFFRSHPFHPGHQLLSKVRHAAALYHVRLALLPGTLPPRSLASPLAFASFTVAALSRLALSFRLSSAQAPSILHRSLTSSSRLGSR